MFALANYFGRQRLRTVEHVVEKSASKHSCVDKEPLGSLLGVTSSATSSGVRAGSFRVLRNNTKRPGCRTAMNETFHREQNNRNHHRLRSCLSRRAKSSEKPREHGFELVDDVTHGRYAGSLLWDDNLLQRVGIFNRRHLCWFHLPELQRRSSSSQTMRCLAIRAGFARIGGSAKPPRSGVNHMADRHAQHSDRCGRLLIVGRAVAPSRC